MGKCTSRHFFPCGGLGEGKCENTTNEGRLSVQLGYILYYT